MISKVFSLKAFKNITPENSKNILGWFVLLNKIIQKRMNENIESGIHIIIRNGKYACYTEYWERMEIKNCGRSFKDWFSGYLMTHSYIIWQRARDYEQYHGYHNLRRKRNKVKKYKISHLLPEGSTKSRVYRWSISLSLSVARIY